MTRGLRWGVLAGLVAAGVTGVVIALVRRRIDPPSVRSRQRRPR